MPRAGLQLIVRAALLAAATMTAAAQARADDDPAAEAEPIVPPRLLGALAPIYPEGAEGDAFVMVAVTVGVDGSVRTARVLEGVEPFASRAIETLSVARFAPATRGGAPIAATVRFRVDFHKIAAPPPEAPPAEPPAEPPPDEPARPGEASPPEAPSEVLVRGGRAAIGVGVADSIVRAEVRQLPGAFGDPFRAIDTAPGFTPVVSGIPYYYVRGAPPGNVGYYFDGVRVPYLFHFGLGPAVIHPALVARTDVYKGGYPAAFGRWAGGVIDSEAMPPSDRLHGEALVRVIDAGALVEAPFAGGRGSALVSGRYAYTSGLFSLLDSKTSLDYRDYQTRVSYALGDRDVISVLGFGAYDHAQQRTLPDRDTLDAASGNGPRPETVKEIEVVLFSSEFHRADLRWDHVFRGGGRMRVGGTLGFDRTRIEARRAAEDVMTAARLDLVQPISPAVLLRAGADVVVDSYAASNLPRFADDDPVVERQRRIFAGRTDFATGARADAVLSLGRVEVTPGLRFDMYGSDRARGTGIDPRVAARFFVTDKFRILHAYGLATQPPAPPIALPGMTIARLEGGLQRSAQTAAGFEVDAPLDVTLGATAFHNAFYDLNDALGTSRVEIIEIEQSDTLISKSRGSAFGLELAARRKLSKRLGGLVAYTLSRSIRQADGRSFLSAYDRPHVLNVALSYDLGRSWRAGGRFVYYSGVPVTPEEPAHAAQILGQPPARTPAFARLDLRIEKRWTIGERGWFSIMVEALNATLSSEVTGYRCGRQLVLPGITRPEPTCIAREFGPVTIPSLGLEGGF
ncbi:MAG: TonB-dependent receptor [Labilithrix sp.]|nr:TonB-dependent receptor [Labilithrix sp.]